MMTTPTAVVLVEQLGLLQVTIVSLVKMALRATKNGLNAFSVYLVILAILTALDVCVQLGQWPLTRILNVNNAEREVCPILFRLFA